ncbi:MAG: PEP-utilizing enzyme [Actinomycetota bacterium]|nr:PEP-utilizing enzyme [Actinomycetota bacterium]
MAINEICALNYLAGTLATAYKGLVTSLLAKDFCICEEGGTAILRGTVLGMPAGDYKAALIHGGVELARAPLKDGFFEVRTPAVKLLEARNLQIDIVQNGRHVGTFLLKKHEAGVYYTPAIELSRELSGLNPMALTGPLASRPGLLRRAEDVIASISSTKKDWIKLSEDLHGLSIDIFWADRDTFYSSFSLLVRFLWLAASGKRCAKGAQGRAAANALDVIMLPLDKEEDAGRLHSAAAVWAANAAASGADLSMEPFRALRVITLLKNRFPDMDAMPIATKLIEDLKKRTVAVQALPPEVIELVKAANIPQGQMATLLRYSEAGKPELLQKIEHALSLIKSGRVDEAVKEASGLDLSILEGEGGVKNLIDTARANLSPGNAAALAGAVMGLLGGKKISAQALEALLSSFPEFFRSLVRLGRGNDEIGRLALGLLKRASASASALAEKTVLDGSTAQAVLGSGFEGLASAYKKMLKGIIIPAARPSGVSSETWAQLVNPLHLQRLAGLLGVLAAGGPALQDVQASIICNIYLSGAFVPDDRIFQRNVSEYLNSDAMQGDFFFNYMLLKKIPVFFSEVGATSTIRDLTTEMDSWGNDPVLYFVRKQTHVNASSHNIRLMEAVMRAWLAVDTALLKDTVPSDVLASINREIFASYSLAVKEFFPGQPGEQDFQNLLKMPEAAIRAKLDSVSASEEMKRKVFLFLRAYQEIVKKYSHASGPPPGDGGQKENALSQALEKMRKLKDIFTSSEKTSAQENLFFKRHIAFGIPSVLGSYREPKFDALSEFLRLEAGVRIMLEEVAGELEKTDRPEGLRAGLEALYGLNCLFGLLGIPDFQLDETCAIMQNARITLSQLADLIRIWQRELKWRVEVFSRTFSPPLAGVISLYPKTGLPEKLMGLDPQVKDFPDKAADIVLRGMLAEATGMTEADRLLAVFTKAVSRAIAANGDIVLNPDAAPVHTELFDPARITKEGAMPLAPEMGGKAKGLLYLNDAGVDIPNWVAFSAIRTEDCRAYTEGNKFREKLRDAVGILEARTGRKFGGAGKPLFIAVRSGSYISMPGILTSILYCGLNRNTLAGFISETGDERLGWDSMRRFLEQYGAAVCGIDTARFEKLSGRLIAEKAVPSRELLDANGVKELVELYESEIKAPADGDWRAWPPPDDVFEQAANAVWAVYSSWYRPKAAQFRQAMNMSDRWGTSVMLIEMVCGNTQKHGAGSSMFFTRNPFTYAKKPFGEFLAHSTGEEIAMGGGRGVPISSDSPAPNKKSLEETNPGLFKIHVDAAEKIERAMGGLPQEVEAAYITPNGAGKFYVVQARRMEPGEAGSLKFDEVCEMGSRIIGRGAGAAGGAVSGAASFSSSAEELEALKKSTGAPVILLRRTVGTEDVSLMPHIGGLVTSFGGITSHAAVLAQKFGIASVVACADMELVADEKGGALGAKFGGTIITEGTPVSIDGRSGLVFSGFCPFIVRK